MKINSDLKRTLSAQAPIINAGVIAANFNWNAKNSSVGIVAARAGVTLCMPMPASPASDRFPITPPTLGPNARLYPYTAQIILITANMIKH